MVDRKTTIGTPGVYKYGIDIASAQPLGNTWVTASSTPVTSFTGASLHGLTQALGIRNP